MRLRKTDEYVEWFFKLHMKEQALVEARLERLRRSDHFGDAKHIGDGVAELRWKNGIRVYFYKESNATIVLLLGGKKNAQKKDIKKAKILFRRYACS